MRRLAVVVPLLLLAVLIAAGASYADGKRPYLEPPKKATGTDKSANQDEQTSLEKLIYDNVPADFQLELKWPFYSRKLGKIVSMWYQPTAKFYIDANTTAEIAGNIYVQTDKNTFCSLSFEGALQWATNLRFRLTAPPKVTAFGLYITNLSTILALDRRSGQTKWMKTYDLTLATPIHATPTMLYVGTWNKLLVGIDRLTGEVAWTYTLDGDIVAEPNDPFAPKPADYVLAPCTDGYLYAVSSAGKLLWKYKSYGRLLAQPVITRIGEDPYVLFGSQDTNLYCVNAVSSQKLWEFRSGAPIEIAPTVVRNKVFVRNISGEFFCLDLKTGAKLWSMKDARYVIGVTSAGDIYLLLGKNTIAAVNPDNGNVHWKRKLSKFTYFMPNCWDSSVYAVTAEGLLLAFKEPVK